MIYDLEIVGLNIGINGLRHSSHKHIEPEVAHEFAMHLLQRLRMFPNGMEQRDGGCISQSPAELFIVHWIHADALLLTGDENAIRVLADGNQRAGFDVIVSMVFYKRLDCLSGKGLELHFVEYDKGLAFHQLYSICEL